MFCFLWLCLLLDYSTAFYYDNKYFDKKDPFKAECVKGETKYKYLGNQDMTETGKKCVPWVHVAEFMISLEIGTKKKKMLENKLKSWEQAIHSKCRSYQLPLTHLFAHNLQRPWCYVVTSGGQQYAAETCLPWCTGEPEEKKEANVTVYEELKINYNVDLIDNLNVLFETYDWGDLEYYDRAPDVKQFSEEFYEIRKYLFISCLTLLSLVTLWFAIVYCLTRRAARSRAEKVEEQIEEENEEWEEKRNKGMEEQQKEIQKEQLEKQKKNPRVVDEVPVEPEVAREQKEKGATTPGQTPTNSDVSPATLPVLQTPVALPASVPGESHTTPEKLPVTSPELVRGPKNDEKLAVAVKELRDPVATTPSQPQKPQISIEKAQNKDLPRNPEETVIPKNQAQKDAKKNGELKLVPKAI